MSTQQHIKNTQAAMSFWATFRECLYSFKELDGPSCLAGWLPFSPYFATLAVVSHASGRPIFSDRPILSSIEMSLELFGCESIFNSREESWYEEGTDHKVVAARLSEHLARLQLRLQNETTLTG